MRIMTRSLGKEAAAANMTIDAWKKEIRERGAAQTLITQKKQFLKKQVQAILLAIGREITIDGGVYKVVTEDIGYDVHTLHLKRVQAPTK
jgi:hypothetical protein